MARHGTDGTELELRPYRDSDQAAVVGLWGRSGLVGFYEKLGYVVEDRVSMGKRFA